ncbi:hypothetical protein SAMN05421821_102106 [Mucilaginibacter lappiensis]|uniref:Uncharacterized protein n=1 Tax=Mucilaginibacter lappiensis TaxID=354630 RepID=A0ABR6PHD5_9SPHI|nr:hypothetical protein [Mucilaginibacter lappiensis]MBB6108659.1 hypothetical protein [Mucilaginibacter lappiensis]SIQ28963.1 hypothetical protein SAMN05421821_102106 [Mucilaginibacter lappiensis]
MQNLFFVLPLVLIAFAIIAVVLFINNKKNIATRYDISKHDTETILVSPSRLTMLSVIMKGLGGLFLFVTLMSINDSINFKEGITYIILGLNVIILNVFVIGLRLFLRRNEVVQLQFEATALKYLSVDWRPKKAARYSCSYLIKNLHFYLIPICAT